VAKSLDRMDVDELTAEIVRLSNEREALRVEQKRVSDRRDALLTEQYERERLAAAGFSPERIDAIAEASLLVMRSKEQGVNGG
jgi:hypothetical protein